MLFLLKHFKTKIYDKKKPIETAYFKTRNEFDTFLDMKQAAWTEWYAPALTPLRAILERARLNGKALCFPEFYRQIRTETDEVIGYLFATPAFWDGKVETLRSLDYYDAWHNFKSKYHKALFGAASFGFQILKVERLFRFFLIPFRKKKLKTKNTMILTAIFVRPGFRGQKIPYRLFKSIKRQVQELDYQWLISPFRPSEYGKYKKESGLFHSEETFTHYCYLKRTDGLPADRWLRALTRNGMIMLKPEVNSFSITKPISRFQEFQTRHKPDHWYQPAPGVWECGETQTWYVDEEKGVAWSVEPDLWGMIPVDGPDIKI